VSKNPRIAFNPVVAKTPTAAKEPTVQKIARALRGEDPNRLVPAWRLSSLELMDPFGWHELTGEKLREIHQKIGDFERRTWNEILIVSKKQNHSVAVSALCKSARDRLAELRLDDVETLVSLRLSGTERVWGIRTHNVLTLLWWDPDHDVCPSLKRNT
jgi:hypothetical protein